MERTPAIRKLFRTRSRVGEGTGRETGGIVYRRRIGWKFHRGARYSDVRRLGGVGEGAHAANESILVDRIADRTALLAKLLEKL